MSKKKATMTLKDFHGGSIPSDLPLPSAPGVTVRPTDGRGFGRQVSWGNPVGRSDHRFHPASAGSARNLDENTPFLSHTSHIGLNFDEDERKPLGWVSGPDRTVGDENIRSHFSRTKEENIGGQSGARVGSRPASVPISQSTSGSSSSSYAGRLSALHNMRLNHQTSNYSIMGGNVETVVGSHQNAWGLRKETATMRDPVSTAWSAPDAVVKLAHASALEKVSSGLWSSKQQVHPLKNAEVFGHHETEGEIEYNDNTTYNKKTYDRLDVGDDSNHDDVALSMHAERNLVINGVHGGGKGVPSYDIPRSTVHVESYEKNTCIPVDGIQSRRPTGISGGNEFQAALPSERPKLKLLPRSKPLESSGQMADYNQQIKQISDHHLAESKYFVQEAKSPVQSGLSGPVVADRAPERRKLNLKPQSQSFEQLEGNSEGKRGPIFGEARSWEVVPKERGIEDDVGSYDSQLPLGAKDGVRKAVDQRTANYFDRQDHQVDATNTDLQRRNRQNEIRLNNRDAGKHLNQQQKQLHDRPPSPETWRKPTEQANPASSDTLPLQYGKATSAVELARAFSKSISSDPAAADRFSGLKGIPSRSTQIPFSRLMGPTPRPEHSH